MPAAPCAAFRIVLGAVLLCLAAAETPAQRLRANMARVAALKDQQAHPSPVPENGPSPQSAAVAPPTPRPGNEVVLPAQFQPSASDAFTRSASNPPVETPESVSNSEGFAELPPAPAPVKGPLGEDGIPFAPAPAPVEAAQPAASSQVPAYTGMPNMQPAGEPLDDEDMPEYDEHGRRNDMRTGVPIGWTPPKPVLGEDGIPYDPSVPPAPAPVPAGRQAHLSSAADAMAGTVGLPSQGRRLRKSGAAVESSMEAGTESAAESKVNAMGQSKLFPPGVGRGSIHPGVQWPPPVPYPDPLPPKIPVIGSTECGLLEKAMVVYAVRCSHVRFSTNWDGCDCFIHLPGNIVPQPKLDYNPFDAGVAPSAAVPGFPGMPTVPPPSSKTAPYNAPPMIPSCPYSNSCADGDFNCVGFNSFGFSEVRMGKYSPASRYFNSINCFFIMKPYDRWLVPKKIEAFWYLQMKRAHVQDFYLTESINVVCKDQTLSNAWHIFCEDYVFTLKFSCDTQWRDLFSGGCKGARPPKEFLMRTELGDICPFECGFQSGELQWPYKQPWAQPWQAGTMGQR